MRQRQEAQGRIQEINGVKNGLEVWGIMAEAEPAGSRSWWRSFSLSWDPLPIPAKNGGSARN